MSKSVACTGHCSNGQDDCHGLPASTMLCAPCAELAALRASLAAAEAKLADADLYVGGMADIRKHFRLRAEMHGLDVAIVVANKLADAEKHADELAAEMEGLLLRYRAHAAIRARGED